MLQINTGSLHKILHRQSTKHKVNLHIVKFILIPWKELGRMWGGVNYFMMPPATGMRESKAPCYHMPDTETGRWTVMKTNEWCSAFSTDGNEFRCWQRDGQIPGLAFKCFLASAMNALSVSLHFSRCLAYSSSFLAITECSIICAEQQVAFDKCLTSNNLSKDLKSLVSVTMLKMSKV